MIERERREGQPICATCNGENPGYYLAPDKDVMRAYCDRLAHRAGEIIKTMAACRTAIDNLPDGDS